MNNAQSTQALVERWATYDNDDVTRMVLECYAPDGPSAMAASPSIALTPIGAAGPAFESRLEDDRQRQLRALPSGACRPSES